LIERILSVLDRAVDACYRPQAFTSDRQCVEFRLYERYTVPLLPGTTSEVVNL